MSEMSDAATSSNPEWLPLLGLARAEQDQAKALLSTVWKTQGFAAALGAIALFIGGPVAFGLAALILAIQVAAWWFRRAAMTCHKRAEEGRRRAHIMFALDLSDERLDIAELRASFTRKACTEGTTLEDPNYWATVEPPGASRLIEALQEGAFYSGRLYRAAGMRAFKIGGSTLGAIVLLLLISLLVLDAEAELVAARLGVGLLGSLMAFDALGLGLDWLAAANHASIIDRRLESVDRSRPESVMAAYTDYSVVTASVAPIPRSLYESEKNRLALLWSQRAGAG